jgi:hypothetical protein
MTTLAFLTESAQPMADPSSALTQACPPEWSRAWLADAYARCKMQGHCANEFGVAWRYQVPESRRPYKPEGDCLCQRYAGTPAAPSAVDG